MSGPNRFRGMVAIATAIVSMLAAPAVASAGGLVDDVLTGVDDTVGALLGGGAGTGGAGGGGPAPASQAQPAPEPAAGTPPDYTPPAHGSNQHGQGTGAIVDLTPSDQEPLPYEPGGGTEDVVVGSSRGEVDENGDYHGHVTILTLLGNELIEGADTNEGESSTGPFGDLNALLADICAGSGNQLCLSVLAVNSQTTATGSANSFDAATASIGPADSPLVTAGAVRTTGTIGDDGQCRTATGTSQVADASVLGVTADVINSSSESRSCNDGSSSQTNGGNVISLGGTGVPLPQPGCEDGTPNTVFNPPLVGLVVSAVCNADDSSTTGGVQVTAPYGVREGLAVFPLGLIGNPLKAVTAASESHALAPGGQVPDGPDAPDGPDDDGPGDRDVGREGDECPPDCPPRGPGAPAGPSAEAAAALPFTGADVGVLAAVGLAMFASGLALMALADRRRRARKLAG